jgi:hypothetical protein
MSRVNLAAPDSKEANSKNATRNVKGKVEVSRTVVAANVVAVNRVAEASKAAANVAAVNKEAAASKAEDN